MRKATWFRILLLIILVPLAGWAANTGSNGHCSAVQGEMIVTANSFNAYFIINGVSEPVVMLFTSGEPVFHGTSDRGSEFAVVTSLVDGSTFIYYEDYTSQHAQNAFTTDPVLYSTVNGAGTIVGVSGRWENASGQMNMHGPFNFAVPDMDLSFNGNICGI